MWYLIFYPYLQVFGNFLLAAINDVIGAEITTQNDSIMIAELVLLAITYIAAIIVSIIARKTATGKKVAIVKLSHIPFYLGVFIIATLAIFTVIGASIAIGFFFLDVMMIIPSGIYMTGVKHAKVWEKLLGFIFVLDVIIACKLWIQEKKGILQ